MSPLRRDPLARPEALVRRVYSYVAYRIGDGPDAEDVTSEVFERALRYRESYDPARGEPAAWLIGIARRRLADGPRPETASADDLPEPSSTRSLEESAVERASLAEALAELDERERELVALRYGADLTARQIGALLDLRANTVEVALHRALEKLRKVLERDEPSPLPADQVKPVRTRP